MMTAGPIAIEPNPMLLVAEISHRVVNEYGLAIAMLRLAAAEQTSIEASAALTRAAEHLRDHAELHRALQAPTQPCPSDLSAHLEKMCAALTRAALDQREVTLTLMTESVLLDADRCWRATLIASELIINALRHGLGGRPGQLVVELAVINGEVVCRVSDSGYGAGHAPAKPSQGMSVVQGLVASLGGRVDWRFAAEGGAAQFGFPLEPALALRRLI